MGGIEDGNKLYPVQAVTDQNFTFWEGVLCRNFGSSARITWGGQGSGFDHEEADMNAKGGAGCALDKLNEIRQVASVSIRSQKCALSCPW